MIFAKNCHCLVAQNHKVKLLVIKNGVYDKTKLRKIDVNEILALKTEDKKVNEEIKRIKDAWENKYEF